MSSWLAYIYLWVYTRVKNQRNSKPIRSYWLRGKHSTQIRHWVYTRVWVQGMKKWSGANMGIAFLPILAVFTYNKYSSYFEKPIFKLASNIESKLRSMKRCFRPLSIVRGKLTVIYIWTNWSSRNNQLKFKVSGELLLILKESIEYTSNEFKKPIRCQHVNWLDLESLGSWLTMLKNFPNTILDPKFLGPKTLIINFKPP